MSSLFVITHTGISARQKGRMLAGLKLTGVVLGDGLHQRMMPIPLIHPTIHSIT